MLSALVVDDDQDLRGALAFRLQRAGFRVTQAADGQAALDAAGAEPPDILLLDWMMPQLDGLQVCRALRADSVLRDTPVIILSAKGMEGDIDDGLAAGADDFITKPFSPAVVVDRIRGVLARAALRGRSGAGRPGSEAELAPEPGGHLSLILDRTGHPGRLRAWGDPAAIELDAPAPMPMPRRGLMHYLAPPGVLVQHGALTAGESARRVAFGALGPPRLLLTRRRLTAALRVPVWVRQADGSERETSSAEIWECGLRLRGTGLGQVREPVELTIALDRLGPPLTAAGEIVRCEDDGTTITHFTAIDRQARERLSWRIFQHLLATRGTARSAR